MGVLDRLTLISEFPKLNSVAFEITSPKDKRYNCIAWAAGEDSRQWWPDSGGSGFWPKGVPREPTLSAFVAAYKTLGYEPCKSASVDSGFEKIAIFVNSSGKPKHAARQLSSGAWTSKMGGLEDIRHDELSGVEGVSYGTAVQFMRRAVPVSTEGSGNDISPPRTKA